MVRYLCWVLIVCWSASAVAQQEIPGVGKVGKARRLHTDFKFTEGPAADGNANLYFTDIPNNTIYKRDRKGTLSTLTLESNHSNGLMCRGKNRLLACEMDGQLVEYDLSSGSKKVIADKYNGQRFNACNDLVIDRHGGIYMTDPRYRAPDPWPQGTEAVYYIAKDGTVSRLIEDRTAPNGIILSPDEKTLYVVPSMEETMWAYPVNSPGVLGERRVFCKVKQPDGASGTGGDGLTIDTKGVLYITTKLGLQVFSPKGKALGIIPIPEHPANVTFGGKGNQTLFVTARTSLYSVQTEATGHVFPGE